MAESVVNFDCYGLLQLRVPNLRLKKGLWYGLVALLLLLNLYAPADPTLTERLLANAIILVAFAAIVNWQRCPDGRPDFGFIPLVMILFVLQFALPMFLLKVYATTISGGRLADADIEKALTLCLVGLLALLAGYYAPIVRFSANAVLPKVRIRWHSRRIVEVAAVLFGFVGMVTFLVTFVINVPREVWSYIVTSSDLYFLSVITLLVLQDWKERSAGYQS